MSATPPETLEFELDHGLVDERGQVHRLGRLRLTTVRDVQACRRDPRSRERPGFFLHLLVSRVLVSLGELGSEAITPELIGELTSRDFQRLLEAYRQLNRTD